MGGIALRLLASGMMLPAITTIVSGDDALTSSREGVPNLSQASIERAPAQRNIPPPVWQKGITYTHLYHPSDNLLSRRSRLSLEHIRSRLHAEWIALNPFGYQSGISDPHVYHGDDPPDPHLLHAIREAHQLGLKVMLKPHIWLRRASSDDWRGVIAMNTEEDWQSWFADYGKFILHYAAMAERENVALFCVGVELSRTAIEREADWRDLITRIRQRYSGPIVYAANWWGEYDRVAFWDAVDYIGINAFFPLTDRADPSLAELRAGAEAVADQIALVQRAANKPVIFTEVGFKSITGTSVRPWEWPRRIEPAINLEEQSRCYQAVLETFWNRPWFYGLYWWKWYSDLNPGGIHDGDFTPRRKPAEQVLSEWYRKPVVTVKAAAPR